MAFTRAQIEGIVAASIVGLIFIGAIGSSAINLKQKNVNFGEATRTIGRSIMGNTTKANSPLRQGSSSVSDAVSDLVSETESILGSSDCCRGGGSRKRCKKGTKTKGKSKGRNKR
jgi:hypothetical protein